MNDIELKPCPDCGSTDVAYFYYDDEVSVFCRHCQYKIAPSRLEKFAAERWNSLHRPPQWTTEKPTEEGWYFIKYKGKVTICHATYPKGSSYMTYKVIGSPDAWSIEFADEWAGPIPEPIKEK